MKFDPKTGTSDRRVTTNTRAPASRIAEEAAAPIGQISARILVVDDHPVVRKGLIACLARRSNFVVLGEAADGIEALRKVEELLPDLLLMDVEMPLMNGLAATASIRKKFPKTKVLLVSMHNNPSYIVQAVQMGARGFILKSSSSENLLKAVDIILQGEPFFPDQTNLAHRPLADSPFASVPEQLFEREREVLVYLAMGYSNRDIAGILAISVRTVESHRARLMRKLDIHTIAGLTRYALSKGYVALDAEAIFPARAEAFLGASSPVRDLRA